MSNRFSLREILELLEERDEALLVKAVSQAVQRAAKARGVDRNTFLGQWRRTYADAMAIKEHEVMDLDKLLDCIVALKIPLEEIIRVTPRPWANLQQDAGVTIVLGERPVEIPEVAKGVQASVVASRDVEALEQLSGFIRDDLDLSCHIAVRRVSSDLSWRKAQQAFNKLRRDAGPGMIIVVGSPVVNAFAEPCAHEILNRRGRGKQLPARFRFSFDLAAAGVSLPPEPLLVGSACRREQEGIWTSDDKRRLAPRMHNEELQRRLEEGEKGPFSDAGMLLLDDSESPSLCLCAGHGAVATQAAVLALTQVSYIEHALAGSLTDSSLGTGRMFEALQVWREKPSARKSLRLDNLQFAPDFNRDEDDRKGWRWV